MQPYVQSLQQVSQIFCGFVTGLATLFFACLVFFFTLFLLAIAYSTSNTSTGNI